MSKVYPSAEVIYKIEKHPNADRLEVAYIIGTTAVVPKDMYKVYEVVDFFPPDVTMSEETSDKLGVTKYLKTDNINKVKVVRATKIRGVVSYGIVVKSSKERVRGEDLSGEYHTGKYEPQPDSKLIAGDGASSPAWFHEYTEIQHYYRNSGILEEDENVVITEKLHGCLQASTLISLADGTRKTIKEIVDNKLDAAVLGYVDGKVKPVRITNWYDNGATNDWYRVKFTRSRMTRGNYCGTLVCTGNHKIFTTENNEYISSKQLTQQDSVLVVRNDVRLTYVQEQVLIGKLLGDGSLAHSNRHIAFSHKIEHKEYLVYTVSSLGDLGILNERGVVSGYGTTMCRGRTLDKFYISDAFSGWVRDGKKQVPNSIIGKLSPISLAFWYMDDGSLSHWRGQEDRAAFATCGFDETSIDVLVEALSVLGINAVKKQYRGYWRLFLHADEAEKLFILISPYVCPCMRYKLPERYRDFPYVELNLYKLTNQYKPFLVQQQILEVVKVDLKKADTHRYDLETESHNFFAGGLLVHNSNARASMGIDGTMHCGSHHGARKPVDVHGRASTYWKPAEALKPLLEDLVRIYSLPVIVFSEIYGPGVQFMHYGLKESTFAIFDISVNGKYLDYKEFVAVNTKHNVPVVPTLYVGPFKKELLESWTSGPATQLGTEKIKGFIGREGCVIKPTKERWDHSVGRVILKSVSADYLSAK